MLISKPGKTLTPRRAEVHPAPAPTSPTHKEPPAPTPTHQKVRKTRSLSRSLSVKDLSDDPPELSPELSIDDRLPGVLKIFGESVLPGAEYKSVLASTRSTAQEIVKQALERYGQEAGQYVQYVLCDVVGLVEDTTSGYSQRPSNKWRTVCRRVLDDGDKPLELQSFWKPCNGFSRRYELHKRIEVVRESLADDTLGLNDNARKLMMAKVAPGAIPFSTSWNSDSARPRMNLHDSNSVQRETLSDDSGATTMSDIRAAQHPYLLTVRGYDTFRDKVQYKLKSQFTRLGKFRGHSYASEIGLAAPDVLQVHCHLVLKSMQDSSSGYVDRRYCYYIELEVCEGAMVCINGQRITRTAHVYAGDMIAIGQHYLFLYKDPTGGYDIPENLSWFPSVSSSIHGSTSSISTRDRAFFGDLLNSSSGDFSASFDAGEGSGCSSEGQQITFAYSRDKEDDVVKAITEIHSCNKRDHPLTPAVLFVACLEHAQRKFTRHHQRNLQRRILFCVREKVADLAKILSEHKYESSVFHFSAPKQEYDPLKVLIYWMSNSVHLYVHVLHELHVHSVNPDPDDDAYACLQEMLTGLEDVVSFSFQQTVYCVTKILYHVVGKVMSSNPFSGNETWERDGIGQILSVMQTTKNISSDVRLHTDVTTQLMTYLLFFLSTSLFNRLITTESEVQYYNWSFGVRLQANLSRLEEWAASKQMDKEFHQVSQHVVALADLMALSKNILVKMDWPAFRSQFSSLNEAQLLKLLRGYHLGMNKGPPDHWFPPEGGVHNPSEEDLPVKLSSHPAFTLPKEGCPVDLAQSFPVGFLEYLEQFQNIYGSEDDDSDSGLSVSNTPRAPEPRPKDGKTFFIMDSPRSGGYVPSRIDAISPARASRATNAVRPSSVGLHPTHHWRARSQDRPPSYADRRRINDSFSQGSKPMSPGPPAVPRKPLVRVPPLDLPSEDDVRNNFSTGPYKKTKSKSSESLLHISTKSANYEHFPKNSIMKSSKANMTFNQGKDNYEEMYVEAQTFNKPKNIKVLTFEDQTNVDTDHSEISAILAAYGLSPRNRRSLPHEDTSYPNITVTGNVINVSLDKGSCQLGLGLIDGLHTPLKSPGIYVKNLLLDSPAYHCGQLNIGDRILAISGHSIAGEDYQSAMMLFRTLGPRLKLVVEKSEKSVVDLISAAKCS